MEERIDLAVDPITQGKLLESSTVYTRLLCLMFVYSTPATGNSLSRTLGLVVLFNGLILFKK